MMRTVEAGGVSLFCMEKGTGPPLVLVHGIPTDYRAWSAQVDHFSENFRTISYSRRYASPKTRTGDLSDSTVENNAKDLAGLLNQLGLGPAHLVGHSYGGFVAAYLALTQPRLMRSLVLVEPAIASLLLRDPNSKTQALRLLLTRPSVAISASRYLKRSHDPAMAALKAGDLNLAVRLNLDGVNDRQGSLDRLSPEISSMMLANARTVAETGTPYPSTTTADLQKITLPTMVLNGGTSALWLRKVGEMTAAAIRCDRVVIPGAGHYPHLERPEDFNRALGRFLNRLNPQAPRPPQT